VWMHLKIRAVQLKAPSGTDLKTAYQERRWW
jgi:leucyl aminopeptidase (aminopeptidase T)